jgi:hypothetical protein
VQNQSVEFQSGYKCVRAKSRRRRAGGRESGKATGQDAQEGTSREGTEKKKADGIRLSRPWSRSQN